MKYKILGLAVLSLIAIQFMPYGKKHTNPQVKADPAWDSKTTSATFFRACSNCHSNETTWPWYSNVAPVSWLIQFDVDEGREHFNVSQWGGQKKNKGNEAAEEVRDGEMPPWYYVIGNPEAKLSAQEKKEFAQGLVATFGDKREAD